MPKEATNYMASVSRQNIKIGAVALYYQNPMDLCCFCLNTTKLNHALIRPDYRGPTINGMFPKVANTQYCTLIKTSSGYHNLILYKIHHIQLMLHINLEGTDMQDNHSVWHQQMPCSSER